MTRSNDILSQIDAALDDPFVSPDAMRCTPEPPEPPKLRVWIGPVDEAPDALTDWQPVEGVTDIRINFEDDAPPVPVVRSAQGREAARRILIGRLVDRHGLNSIEAADAIDEAEAGLDGPHTHLVRIEARAVMDEAVMPVVDAMRRMVEAARPAVEAVVRAMRQFAEATQRARTTRPDGYVLAPPPACPHHTPPPRRDGRPAWQSPYGPPARRNRR